MSDGTIRIDTDLDASGLEKGLKASDLIALDVAKSIVTSIGGALKDVAADIYTTGSEFEAQMSNVKAISGATGSEFEQLEAQAKSLGATTAFSASEAAAGMENLASAGFEVEDILSAMPGLLDLAAVSGGDVGRAAEVAGAAINAFGLETDQAGHVADVFARAAADTNAEVNDMGEAMKYAGPIANALGITMEETAAAVGIMSDAGIKGSQAGTSLRGALTRLTKPTKAMSAVMDNLGINIRDSEGNMKSISGIVGELETAFVGLTAEEKEYALATIFGTESMSGWLALVEKGSDGIDDLTLSLENSSGAAYEMARIMQDNLKGDVEELDGAFETLGLIVYDVFGDALREGVQSASTSVNELNNAISAPKMQESLHKLAKSIGNVIAAAIDLASKALPLVVNAIAFFIDHGDKLISVLAGVLAGFVAFHVIATVAEIVAAVSAGFTLLEGAMLALPPIMNLVTAAQTKLNLAMLATPFAGWALAIGGIVAAIGIAISVTENYESETRKLAGEIESLTEEVDGLNAGFESSRQARKNNIDGIMAQGAATKKLSDQIIELSDIENKSAKDKQQLKLYVDLLNDSVDGLNLQYDMQNDKLSMNAEQIRASTEAWKEQLLLNAKQEDAAELARELISAETAQQEAKDSLTKAQNAYNTALAEQEEKYGNSYQQYVNQSAELGNLQENLKNAQTVYDDVTASVDSLNTELDNTVEGIATYEASMQQMTEATLDVGETVEEVTMSVGEYWATTSGSVSTAVSGIIAHFSESEKASEKMIDAWMDMHGQATSIFSSLEVNVATSLGEMQQNLQQDAALMSEWADLIVQLSEKGYNEGIVQQAANAGPAAIESVRNMVNGTTEEVERMNEDYETAAKAAAEAYAAGLSNEDVKNEINVALGVWGDAVSENTAVEDALKEKAPIIQEDFANAMSDANFSEVPEQALEEVADAISEDETIAEAADQNIADVKDNAIQSVEENNFDEVGENIDKDAGEKLEQSDGLKTAAETKISETKNSMDSAILGAGFEQVGINIVDGAASGMMSNGAMNSAAKALVENALATMESTADSHSPARRFMPLGGNIDEGLAVGLLANDFTPKAAKELIQSTQAAVQQQQSTFSAKAQNDFGAAYYSSNNYYNSTDNGSSNSSATIEVTVITENMNTSEADDVGRKIGKSIDDELRYRKTVNRI